MLELQNDMNGTILGIQILPVFSECIFNKGQLIEFCLIVASFLFNNCPELNLSWCFQFLMEINSVH